MADDHINKSDVTEALEEALGHPLRRASDSRTLDLHANVGRLEQSIQSTNSALRDFAAQTNSSIDRLTRSFEEVNKSVLQGRQTNWGMIASWAGVLILLLGLVVYQPLQEIRSGINEHTEDGHPESVINRIHNNEKRFADILSGFQRELTLLENSDKERHSKSEQRIYEAEQWINDHREESPSQHAIHDTRLDNLQKEIDMLRAEHKNHSSDNVSLQERILDIEREIYSGASYRSGRPIKPAK